MTAPSASSTNLAYLDDPGRVDMLRDRIRAKPFLRSFYDEIYSKYAEVISRCPKEGLVVELGSGAGFVKDRLPEVVTTDTLAYSGIDQVVDATRMPFADGSLRAIVMMNVFHHIPDVEAFLREATRCLRPGGRIYLLDQHVGWLSSILLKHVHHEPFDAATHEWRFASSGPLSGANGALAWIVFRRDAERLRALFPSLKLERYEPHTPLRYWISGGLNTWTLVPGWSFKAVTAAERMVTRLNPGCSSFVDIELVRV